MARKSPQRQMSYAAIPQQQVIKPAFTVEKLPGTRPHRVHIFDKEANRIKSKVVQEPAGYLVKFMKGHSIRCRDDAHLRMIGAGMQLVPLMDDEGEVKGVMPNIDLPDMEDERDEDDMDIEVAQE